MPNVQIPQRLLLELYQYHVLGRRSPVVDETFIIDELEKKFSSWQRRVDYGAAIEQERKGEKNT